MANKTLLKEEVLERIANETYKEIMFLSENSRPREVFLYGANQEYLVRVMLRLCEKLNGQKTKIFIGDSKKGYSVDVGFYINHLGVS